MTDKEREQATSALIAIEQYLTTLVHVAIDGPGTHGFGMLDRARDNLLDKLEAFMKAANK